MTSALAIAVTLAAIPAAPPDLPLAAKVAQLERKVDKLADCHVLLAERHYTDLVHIYEDLHDLESIVRRYADGRPEQARKLTRDLVRKLLDRIDADPGEHFNTCLEYVPEPGHGGGHVAP